MRNSHWLSDFLAQSGLNSDIVSEKMSQIQLDSIIRAWYTSFRLISGKITNFQVEKSEIGMASRVLSLVIKSFSCMIDYFFLSKLYNLRTTIRHFESCNSQMHKTEDKV